MLIVLGFYIDLFEWFYISVVDSMQLAVELMQTRVCHGACILL